MLRIWLYCHCNCIQVAVAWKRCRCVSSCLPRNPDTDLETAIVWCADKFLSFMELPNRSDWVMPGDHRDCGVKHSPTMGRSSFHHQRPTQVPPAQPHHSMVLQPILSPFCELLPELPECLLCALWSQPYAKTQGKPSGCHSKAKVALWLQPEYLIQCLKLVAPDVSQGILQKWSAEELTSICQLCAKCILLSSNAKAWGGSWAALVWWVY